MKFAIAGCRGYPSHYGGFETFVRHLAPELARRGHEVVVFGHGGRRPHNTIDDLGVNAVNTYGLHGKSVSTLSHGVTAALQIRNNGFDAALLLNVANGFFIPLIRNAEVPVAMNVDGIEWERGKWGRVGKLIFRTGAHASSRWADRLVADSTSIADIWREQFGVTPVYIPYGADPPFSPPGDNLLQGIGVRTPYLLAVARLVPENNVDLTVDAFEQLDTTAQLVVVGSANFANPLVTRLNRGADRGHLRWLGHVSDETLLHQLWANCSLYIHGHQVGGTNPALLEALATGAPTTALNTPFNSEVLGIGHPGLYERNVLDLKARMAAALVGDTTAVVTSDEGQSIVRERYRWQVVIDEYERLLLELAAQ
jgi:glycosyltransferase involved in cell wall biosynthesis